MIIREAADEDWAGIYPFFTAIVTAGDTYAYPDHLSLDEARPWWMEQPPGRTVVAVEDDIVTGSAKMGPNRPGRGSHVATASFMVDPQQAGRGVGRALGEEALAWARSSGYRSMQFNAVVETNTGAVHLWQALGFRILTTVPEAFNRRAHGLVGLHARHVSESCRERARATCPASDAAPLTDPRPERAVCGVSGRVGATGGSAGTMVWWASTRIHAPRP